ncbi:hypothetical protein [Flavobacterium sp. GNP002]
MMTKISIIIIEGIDLMLYKINTFKNKEFIPKWFTIVLTIIIWTIVLYRISKDEIDYNLLLITSLFFIPFLIFFTAAYIYSLNISLKDRKLRSFGSLSGVSANDDKNNTIDEAEQPIVELINLPLDKIKQNQYLNVQQINIDLLQEFENFFVDGQFEKFIKIATANNILDTNCKWIYKQNSKQKFSPILFHYLQQIGVLKNKELYTTKKYVNVTNELFGLNIHPSLYSVDTNNLREKDIIQYYKEFLKFKDN